jgi:hypothetical protein
VVLNVIFWLALVAFLVTHGFHVPASHSGHQSQSASILVIVATGVGVVLLGTFGGLFYLLTRGQQQASRVIRRVASRIRFLDADRTTALVEHLAERFAVLMRDRSLTRRAIGWAAANWLLDAASLWVFVAAFSHFISPVDLLVAYGLANILAAIPITPGGLGVVEFVLVSMITGFGPTAGQALSGVLAYRAVNFWLPIPFGGLAYASIEFQRRPAYRRLTEFLHRRFERSGTPAHTSAPAASPGTATNSSATNSPATNSSARNSSSPRSSSAGRLAGAMGRSLTGTLSGVNRSGTASASTTDGTARPVGPASEATTRSGSFRPDPGARPEPAFGTDPAG